MILHLDIPLLLLRLHLRLFLGLGLGLGRMVKGRKLFLWRVTGLERKKVSPNVCFYKPEFFLDLLYSFDPSPFGRGQHIS